MSKPDTKQKILDTAEALFAREGYQGASLRAITAEAGVNLAAVNYHFGSKEALLEEVFARRLLPLNEYRFKGLKDLQDRASREGRRPEVEKVLRAFIAPVLGFRSSDPGARSFVTFIGRAMAESDSMVRDIFLTHMRPVFLLCFEILDQALPDMSRDELFWRLHFTIGAMSHTMCIEQKETLFPEGIAPLQDEDSMLSRLVSFVTAGMEAP